MSTIKESSKVPFEYSCLYEKEKVSPGCMSSSVVGILGLVGGQFIFGPVLTTPHS